MEYSDLSVGAELPYSYVYEIVNLLNGKTYVGSRKLALDKSWRQYMGSGKLIKQAIAKYGVEKFRKRLIGYAATAEELIDLEGDWISRQQLHGLAQYNLFASGHAGGDTFSKLKAKTLEEVRRKQSEGVRRHLETNTVWNSGKTAETDPRLKAQIERSVARGVYRKSQLGKKMSDSARASMARAMIGNTNSQGNKEEHRRVEIGLVSKRVVTSSGLTGIELHDEMLAVIASFNPDADSLRPLARLHGYSYTTLRKFSYGHGPTSRGAECILCLARSKYPHLLKSTELIASHGVPSTTMLESSLLESFR